MRIQVGSTLLLIAVGFGGLAIAQQNQNRQLTQPPKPKSIIIGQSLESVSGILKQQGIEFSEGGFAITRSDPDRSNLFFKLDEDHTWVCAYFSISKQTITGLSIVFFPDRTSQAKAFRSWISATELALYPDKSYAVHFSKPLTREQLREAEANRPKDEFPKSP